MKRSKKAIRWILPYSRRIGHARIGRFSVVTLMLWSVFLPIFQTIQEVKAYQLTPAQQKVVGTVNKNLDKKFSYDSQGQQWQFNKEGQAVRATELARAQGGSADAPGMMQVLKRLQMQSKVGGGGAKSESLYSVNLPSDPKKGIQYFDNNTGLSFAMKPKFESQVGKVWEGRMVYPVNDAIKIVYTPKNNGIKEDIVFEKFISEFVSYSYDLQLPKTLEARLLEDGSLGIFSADASLFVATTSGEQDEEKLKSARESGPKNHLVFLIPAPIVKDQRGQEVRATYSLREHTLTVAVDGLEKLSYPLSLDPSVVVTSTADFSAGNDEGGIQFDANSISATEQTGGNYADTWTSRGIFDTTGQERGYLARATYNNYMYIAGGYDGVTTYDEVRYVLVNSDGTLGVWANTTALPNQTHSASMVAYNGYMYVLGGIYAPSNAAQHKVWVAPINTDGTLGSWTDLTPGFSIDRQNLCAFAYNGYMYVAGGMNILGSTNSVQYAEIKADGSLGTWTDTTVLPSKLRGHSMFASNDYVYVLGGHNDTSEVANVYYAAINENGTLGAWTATTSLPNILEGHDAFVLSGHVYLVGGKRGSTYSANTNYAPIQAGGGLGQWENTANYTGTRTNLAAMAVGKNVYVIGGCNATVCYNTVQSNFARPVGFLTTFKSGTLPQDRYGFASAVYQGRIFIAGGTNDASGALKTAVCSTINSADYSLGAFTNLTNLPVSARGWVGFASNDKYLYILGGNSGTTYYNTVIKGTMSDSSCAITWDTASQTALPSVRAGFGTVIYNNYIYTVGGESTSTTSHNDIRYAPLNTSGDVGAWTTVTGSFSARYRTNAVVYGGNLYVIAGRHGTTQFTDIWRAPINSSGGLGTWTQQTAMFTKRAGQETVIYNGYMYVIGGWAGGTTYLTDVLYAPMNADGSVGSFVANRSFTTAVTTPGVVVHEGYMYIMGGNNTASQNTIAYARINNGGPGSLNPWASTTGLGAVRKMAASAAYNGYVYILGGEDDSATQYADVRYAKINADGSLGTWITTAPNFTTVRSQHQALAYKGFLYVLGGITSGSTGLNDVQFAQINSDGSIGGWQATTSFTGFRNNFGAAVYEGYMYVLGGTNGGYLSDVQYAPINPSGSVGTWASTTSLPSARFGMAVIVQNGYLYSIGGATTGGTAVATVEYAPINLNGTIGSWVATTGLPSARQFNSAFTYNGYMYSMGGSYGLVSKNDVVFAPIHTNGTLGSWADTRRFTSPRDSFASVAYGGNIYILGGTYDFGAGSLSDVQYAGMMSIIRRAEYSKLVTLASNAKSVAVIYSGTTSPESNIYYKISDASTASFGMLRPGGESTTANLGCGTLSGQYNKVWIKMVIDDTLNTNYGQPAQLSRSSVTDATVLYDVNVLVSPDKRLFGGKWFLNEVLQPHQTCEL